MGRVLGWGSKWEVELHRILAQFQKIFGQHVFKPYFMALQHNSHILLHEFGLEMLFIPCELS